MCRPTEENAMREEQQTPLERLIAAGEFLANNPLGATPGAVKRWKDALAEVNAAAEAPEPHPDDAPGFIEFPAGEFPHLIY
jgi:hypothetical protein